MVRLHRSSWHSLCLALILGLALAWPGLAHRRLHQHTHSHVDHGRSVSAHVIGSESHHADHPHLDLIATAPTKAGLQLALVVLEHPVLTVSPLVVVGVSHAAAASTRPRAPPAGPPPPIRAPPTA